MAFSSGGSDGLMSDINVTPLVDVMLVLLIIFMVTAPMMSQGVDVDLPEAATDPLSADKEPLVVTIDKDGVVYISELKVEVNYLQEKLRKILEGRKNKEVYFKADKDVAYGIVVQVMAEIKGAGIEKLGMITVPPSETAEKKS
ncbi:MAG: protein TolR [Desulfosarcinaceae bacterium]|jgi:biopolymer transport protein TolR